jgi:hypothetical protein
MHDAMSSSLIIAKLNSSGRSARKHGESLSLTAAILAVGVEKACDLAG